jgi:mono/diheme cytochrome c family protein
MKSVVSLALSAMSAIVAMVPLAGCSPESAKAASGNVLSRERIERGRYLVAAAGCGDCHTPKMMTPQGPREDQGRLLAGFPEGAQLPPAPAGSGPWIATASWDQTAWAGPWGVSYATNLTPDRNTGLGIWTEDMFVRALRTGRHMGVSRPILPPMPWTALKNMSDEDLKAIYAYLRTIPAVHNRVPEPLPPAGAAQAAR